ncbi:hypothetical protein QOT17_002723 [Balamuthia mandrillaris]
MMMMTITKSARIKHWTSVIPLSYNTYPYLSFLFPMPIELVSIRLFPYRPYHTWRHQLTFFLGFLEETWSASVAVFGDVKCQELPRSLSGPPSSGAIPPASGTPSPTTTSTTLPTDRLDAIDQALSELRASQADHDRLLVKQTSDASSLSDHIHHIDAKLETFADELLNDIKRVNDSHDVALAALNDAISQLQNLLKAKLADKDDGLGSGSSSSSSSEEEEEKEKEKRKPALNLTARRQDL